MNMSIISEQANSALLMSVTSGKFQRREFMMRYLVVLVLYLILLMVVFEVITNYNTVHHVIRYS